MVATDWGRANVSIVPGIVLHDIVGLPAEVGDILLVPSLFDFCVGDEGSTEYHLADFVPELDPLRALFNCFDHHDDLILQIWVRARIPVAFAFHPPIGGDLQRRDLLDFPFLAVFPSGSGATLSAVPFVCVEGYSGPGLTFRKTDAASTKERIAAAFWRVLLQMPEDIAPFEEWMYDEEAGVLKVGCGPGILYLSDLEDWDDESPHFDIHLSPFPGELFACPDCGATGIEDLFPFTEDCASCNGTGVVTW
jgi:hypothetical protein